MFRGLTRAEHRTALLLSAGLILTVFIIHYQRNRTEELTPASISGPVTWHEPGELIPGSGEPSATPDAEPPLADAMDAGRVDINVADAETLQVLPGIGPAKAAAIVSHRDQHGLFPTIEALDDVSGIGPKTMDRLRPMLTVSGVPPAAAAAGHLPGSPPPAGGYSTPPADAASAYVSLNSATQEQLQALDGVGEVKAQAIIDYRNRNGGFSSVEQLMQVRGIGPKTFEKNRHRLRL